jgi:hypothetical protein
MEVATLSVGPHFRGPQIRRDPWSIAHFVAKWLQGALARALDLEPVSL